MQWTQNPAWCVRDYIVVSEVHGTEYSIDGVTAGQGMELTIYDGIDSNSYRTIFDRSWASGTSEIDTLEPIGIGNVSWRQVGAVTFPVSSGVHNSAQWTGFTNECLGGCYAHGLVVDHDCHQAGTDFNEIPMPHVGGYWF